jgi:hypothetical protein
VRCGEIERKGREERKKREIERKGREEREKREKRGRGERGER